MRLQQFRNKSDDPGALRESTATAAARPCTDSDRRRLRLSSAQRGSAIMSVVIGIGVLGIVIAGVTDTFSESTRIQQTTLNKQAMLTQYLAVVELLSRRETCRANFLGVDVAGLPRAPAGNQLLALISPGPPPQTQPVYRVNDTFENGRFTLTDISLRNWRPRGTTGPDQFKGSFDLELSFRPTSGVAAKRIVPIAAELNGYTAGAANPTQIASCVSVGNDINQPWRVTEAGDITFMGGNVGIDIANPTQRLQVNGFVLATGYLHPSDRRLKTAIMPAPGLAAIERLRGVSFRWKSTGLAGNGVIAQEVEAVVPHAVNTDSAGEKSVNYSALIAPLIEAVKELHANNLKLEQELAARHAEIERLRAEIERR